MEEKRDDLDNLIIQSKKPSGLKKILLAAAVLLLVLILIILVTKSLLEGENTPRSSVILPPEPVTTPAAPVKEPLFEQVPIEDEKEKGEKKIDEVIERLKKDAPQDSVEAKKVEQKPIKALPTQPKAEASRESVKKETIKAEPKVEAKSVKKSERKAAKGEYYIQVGAFFRYPPDKKFLNSIKKEGLEYIIVEGTKNGKPYKKVLVGPYMSKSEANKALGKVKKRINQNAYITRQK